MEEEATPSTECPKALTIKIAAASSCRGSGGQISPAISISMSPNLSSPSPPSSAFVSALQSPYISPRAALAALDPDTTTTTIGSSIPSPISHSAGSHSDDLPSTSYTPPSERYDFVIDNPTAADRPKFSDAGPRISFSFPAPRTSFTKALPAASSSSPPSAANAKLRSCDVYVGYHGHGQSAAGLARFCRWLKAELELQGIASFVADRARYSDGQSHEIADRIICSAAVGVVVVSPSSFLNPLSVEELRFFAQKRNLVPLLFGADRSEVARLVEERLEDKEALEALARLDELRLEADGGGSNWRSCVLRAVGVLQSKLGRKSICGGGGGGREEDVAELPFPRNKHFVGRDKELAEIETAFFGCAAGDALEVECPKPVPVLPNGGSNGSSDGFADEETDTTVRTSGKYISLEMSRCKEPTLEAWIEPMIELKGRSLLQRQRSKHKKPRGGGIRGYGNASVVCVSGISGVGKTELALEFAHRYSQRYKMVLWVGGEARYFRQNILNLSISLGLDVSAEAEKERGRIRSFDEQELDAFQRVKRELFRDVPYLLVIDNLETEKEWWEGKDLHDLIPRNMGATHVLVTTRLPKVMSFEPIQLLPPSPSDSLLLIRGKRKKDYPGEEVEVLRKMGERLGRLSFGLWVVGSLLSELSIPPSALLDAVGRMPLNDSLVSDDGFCGNNQFLMKVLVFCFAVLDRANGSRGLASRMALTGAWFPPAPISSGLLAAAASKLPSKASSFPPWGQYCCFAPQARKSEVDSALMVVKLGLAKRAARQPGCWIQFHPIVQRFVKQRGGLPAAKATVQAVRRVGNAGLNSDHLWASAFLVFGFKSEPPLVQLKAADMVLFIKKTALPLAIRSFMTFSRCNSALELLKVCTNVLEEVEKSFVSQVQDWGHGSLCWKKKKVLQARNQQRVDEYVWQDVTLLKAALLETRAKLLLRGGHFDSGEELCRTCISIRTVMLGHNHAQTLAAQDTLAKLVRLRSKI